MNYAIIFAGGVGNRMKNGAMPKQFLELHNKPIIIYTLEKFERNSEIDQIIVVCVKGWEKYLQDKISLFGLKKVVKILTGGVTAVQSQFVGLQYIHDLDNSSNAIVLLHDGVRPLIDDKTITKNVQSVRNNGNAITVVPAIETIGFISDNEKLDKFMDRSKCVMARAPQSYYLDDIYGTHLKAQAEGNESFVDSATMMQHYGTALCTVEGNTNNIKVTTPTDFFIFRAILDAEENQQIFGD